MCIRDSSKAGITEDFDSTPDMIFDNDIGGEINTDTDNEINDNGTKDEDDADPASISSNKLDLALIITTERDFVEKGDFVDFDIQLFNQGETSISSVMIINQVPAGFGLINTDWTLDSTGPNNKTCLLYTSPSPRDATLSRMPSSA